MLRGWILAAVGVGTICLSGVPCPASRWRHRWPIGCGFSPAARTRRRKPRRFATATCRPAAAAAHRARAASAARNAAAHQRRSRRRRRVLVAIPSAELAAAIDAAGNESLDEPPMPYDPAELSRPAPRRDAPAAPHRERRAGARRQPTHGSASAARRPAPRRRATSGARRATTRGRRLACPASWSHLAQHRRHASQRTCRSPHGPARRRDERDRDGIGRRRRRSRRRPLGRDGRRRRRPATCASPTPARRPTREPARGPAGGATARGPVDVRDGARRRGGASARRLRTPAADAAPPARCADASHRAAHDCRRRGARRCAAPARRDRRRRRRSPMNASRGTRASPAVSEAAPLGGIAADAAPPLRRRRRRPSPRRRPSTAGANRPRRVPATPPSAPHGNLRPRSDVLLSVRQPVIVSSVDGPQRIVVGRTAEYRVALENKGDEAARDMIADDRRARVGRSGRRGRLERRRRSRRGRRRGRTEHRCSGSLYELAPGASQTLTLQLIPRSGRPLQLGVAVEPRPGRAAEATVEVQEPKLQMDITGPAEVMFGKSQRYTLTLSNPGTGAAEDVIDRADAAGRRSQGARAAQGRRAGRRRRRRRSSWS